jgi:acyl-CoA thioester hydrolase
MAPDPLQGYPVQVEIPVAWGEMDAFGHVNNVVYFRYFESARIACFERLGYPELTTTTGLGPILASTDCRFRLPLTYPDTVVAAARIGAIGADDFMMHYLVVSRRHGRVAAEGSGRIVSYDYGKQCKSPLPPELRARLEAFAAGD